MYNYQIFEKLWLYQFYLRVSTVLLMKKIQSFRHRTGAKKNRLAVIEEVPIASESQTIFSYLQSVGEEDGDFELGSCKIQLSLE
ncbi:hypothetical protein SS50377_27822 [Spironucleus salmonicida]|uniref:Uncharacterized protein n=1 Tax=Spironucleus salmonicida TaxID=348837 RepID=A0A9P8LKN8_9EUKA|nr:hypothetical protein SS50377_27822 [Spironucleus salmonicida]